MKKIIAIFTAAALFASCSNDFLNKTPLDKLSEDAVFNSTALAENYINALYTVLPDPFQEGNIGCITDEGYFRYGGTSTRFIASGTMTPDNVMYQNEGGTAHSTRTTFLNIWNRTYDRIYRMNYFLSYVDEKGTKIPTEDIDRLKGEVYFLRAWAYTNLIERYAGVPIITKAYDLKDTYDASRNNFDECVDFILQDLDKAESLLPAKDKAVKGRANKDIVLALRSRLTLLMGIGLQVSSITMTVFYIILMYVWKYTFLDLSIPFALEVIVWVSAIARILICLLPQNNWCTEDGNAKLSLLRNAVFTVTGICVIALYAISVNANHYHMTRMVAAIILSFGCYLPVTLFSKTKPKGGLLMIPKTCAYMWMIAMGLQLLFR